MGPGYLLATAFDRYTLKVILRLMMRNCVKTKLGFRVNHEICMNHSVLQQYIYSIFKIVVVQRFNILMTHTLACIEIHQRLICRCTCNQSHTYKEADVDDIIVVAT